VSLLLRRTVVSLESRSSFAALALLAALTACQGGDAEANAEEAAMVPGEMATMATPGAVVDLPNPFPTMIRPFGTLPAGREFGQVSAIDLDSDGRHLWVADRCGASSCSAAQDLDVVYKFDQDGNVVTSFGAGMFIRPHGVTVDADGNVWVTDHQNVDAEEAAQFPAAVGKGQQVFKFSPTGEVLLALGTAGEPGDPPARLNNPTSVAIAPNGDIFVSEGHGGTEMGRVSKFSSDGTFIKSFGQFGEGPGQFRTPHGMAFDAQGRLYVADRGNSRIQVFDQEGTFLHELRQFGRPNDVHITEDGVLYSIDSESDSESNPGFVRGIYIGNVETGEVTGYIPAHPSERPQDVGMGTIGEGVVIDADGNLYVAEVSIRGMTKYMPD
jgi:DNA-binding beta-propeller fold protein YncE